jgi:restriction system protein
MGMPGYYEMLPVVLEFYGDGKERHITELYSYIGQEYGLTQGELNQPGRDEKHTAIGNVVGQAVRRLKRYDVIESPRRSYYKITQKGLDFLKSKPSEVNDKTLGEFQRPWSPPRERKERPVKEAAEIVEMPAAEENIGMTIDAMKARLRDELLRRIKGSEPSFFERLVIDLLKKMGYGGSIKGSAMAIGKTGDEGIDGVIKEDAFGLDAIYVQAKRWENVIGRPEVQKFAGALHGQKARKGIFITTSGFTREAVEYVMGIDIKIVLVDGRELAELMIEHNVGVWAVSCYEIKRIDEKYFEACCV